MLSESSYIFFFLIPVIKGSDSSVERFLDETAAVKNFIDDEKRLLLDFAVEVDRLLDDECAEEFAEYRRPFSIQLLCDPDCVEVTAKDGYLNRNDEDGEDDNDDKENGCADLSAYFPLSSGCT